MDVLWGRYHSQRESPEARGSRVCSMERSSWQSRIAGRPQVTLLSGTFNKSPTIFEPLVPIHTMELISHLCTPGNIAMRISYKGCEAAFEPESTRGTLKCVCHHRHRVRGLLSQGTPLPPASRIPVLPYVITGTVNQGLHFTAI